MKEVRPNESSSVCEADLREVQDHQAEGPRHGHLRESEAQAEAGLRFKEKSRTVIQPGFFHTQIEMVRHRFRGAGSGTARPQRLSLKKSASAFRDFPKDISFTGNTGDAAVLLSGQARGGACEADNPRQILFR